MTRGGNGDRKQHPPRSSQKKKGQLTGEDQELWQKLAQTVEPLHQMKPRVREGERSGLDRSVSPADPGIRPTPSANVPRRSDPFPIVRQPHGPKAPPPLAPFDRKRSRRIASGRIEIQARLDLHGARQSEAYSRFRAFLVDSAAQGMSTVLVVTGKGGPRSNNAGRHELDGYGVAAPERGVLRRSVPLWLEEPELRLLVASYTAADIKHGGGGAIYIHLRKRRDRRET